MPALLLGCNVLICYGESGTGVALLNGAAGRFGQANSGRSFTGICPHKLGGAPQRFHGCLIATVSIADACDGSQRSNPSGPIAAFDLYASSTASQLAVLFFTLGARVSVALICVGQDSRPVIPTMSFHPPQQRHPSVARRSGTHSGV